MDKTISITIYLEQTCNDILAECNLIGKNLGETANAQLQADIKSPDSAETRSIICRAHTEALGNVKLACHRYLMSGRTEDDNKLERLAFQRGTGLVDPVTYEETQEVVWEHVDLTLKIPDFDTAVTDALKNHIHKYIVDYVMWRFLQNQSDAKCVEYKKLADEEDYPMIEHDLTIREKFTSRTPQFF